MKAVTNNMRFARSNMTENSDYEKTAKNVGETNQLENIALKKQKEKRLFSEPLFAWQGACIECLVRHKVRK